VVRIDEDSPGGSAVGPLDLEREHHQQECVEAVVVFRIGVQTVIGMAMAAVVGVRNTMGRIIAAMVPIE